MAEYMAHWGYGVQAIFDYCERAGSDPPDPLLLLGSYVANEHWQLACTPHPCIPDMDCQPLARLVFAVLFERKQPVVVTSQIVDLFGQHWLPFINAHHKRATCNRCSHPDLLHDPADNPACRYAFIWAVMHTNGPDELWLPLVTRYPIPWAAYVTVLDAEVPHDHHNFWSGLFFDRSLAWRQWAVARGIRLRVDT